MNFKEFLLFQEGEHEIAKVETAISKGNLNINPSTGKVWKTDQKVDQLKYILNRQLKRGVKPSDLWCHFSDIPKLGINPKSSYGGTPIGIYAYPIEYVIENRGNVPYASGRPFIITFRVKNKNGIINIQPYKDDKFKEKSKRKIIGFETKSSLPRLDFSKIIYLSKSKAQEMVDKFIRKNIPKKYHEISSELYGKLAQDILAYLLNEYNLLPGASPYEKLGNMNLENMLTYLMYFTEESVKSLIVKNKNQINMFLHKITYITNWGTREPKYVVDEYQPGALKYSHNYVETLLYKAREKKDIKLGSPSHQKLSKFEQQLYTKRFTVKNPPKDKQFITGDGKKVLKLLDENKKIKMFIDKKRLIRIARYFFKKFLEIFKNLHKQYGEKIKDKIPFKDKLQSLANEYGFDLKDIMSNMDRNFSVTHGERVIYDITKEIAKKMEQGGRVEKISARWTNILRKLGIKGIMDRNDTATIHSGEPTQGVFFETNILEIVSIIDQYNSRPELVWDNIIKKHRISTKRITNFQKEKRQILSEILQKLTKVTYRISAMDCTKPDNNALDYLTRLLTSCKNFLETTKIDQDLLDFLYYVREDQYSVFKNLIRRLTEQWENYSTCYNQNMIKKIHISLNICQYLDNYIRKGIYDRYRRQRYETAVKSI